MIAETQSLTDTVVSLAELPPKVEDARRKKGALMVIALFLTVFLVFYFIGRRSRT
jgi:hypothetical protein